MDDFFAELVADYRGSFAVWGGGAEEDCRDGAFGPEAGCRGGGSEPEFNFAEAMEMFIRDENPQENAETDAAFSAWAAPRGRTASAAAAQRPRGDESSSESEDDSDADFETLESFLAPPSGAKAAAAAAPRVAQLPRQDADEDEDFDESMLPAGFEPEEEALTLGSFVY